MAEPPISLTEQVRFQLMQPAVQQNKWRMVSILAPKGRFGSCFAPKPIGMEHPTENGEIPARLRLRAHRSTTEKLLQHREKEEEFQAPG